MTPNLLYIVVIGVLFAAGVSLLLERSLTRVVMGVILLSNGANLLLLAAAAPGGPPIVGTTARERMSDPLPQVMILTAIVITLGITAFLLALAYRSWFLTGNDEVQDDVEDRRIRRQPTHGQDPTTGSAPDSPPAAADGGARPPGEQP